MILLVDVICESSRCTARVCGVGWWCRKTIENGVRCTIVRLDVRFEKDLVVRRWWYMWTTAVSVQQSGFGTHVGVIGTGASCNTSIDPVFVLRAIRSISEIGVIIISSYTWKGVYTGLSLCSADIASACLLRCRDASILHAWEDSYSRTVRSIETIEWTWSDGVAWCLWRFYSWRYMEAWEKVVCSEWEECFQESSGLDMLCV